VRQTVVKHKTDFAVLEILINARKKTLWIWLDVW
jgi:hypothetical protein